MAGQDLRWDRLNDDSQLLVDLSHLEVGDTTAKKLRAGTLWALLHHSQLLLLLNKDL